MPTSTPRTNPTNDQIENWFTYHSPTSDQLPKYQEIRDTAKALAFVIANNVPDVADRLAAIRLLRECVMTANAGIACGDPLTRGAGT